MRTTRKLGSEVEVGDSLVFLSHLYRIAEIVPASAATTALPGARRAIAEGREWSITLAPGQMVEVAR